MKQDFLIHKLDITIKVVTDNMLEVSWYGFNTRHDIDGMVLVQTDDDHNDIFMTIEHDMHPMEIGDNTSVNVYLKNPNKRKSVSKDACPMLKKLVNEIQFRTRKLHFSGLVTSEVDM